MSARSFLAVSALAAFLLLGVAPPGSADGEAPSAQELCIITIEPSMDFRVVRIYADLVLSDEDWENLSQEVDADHDGTITPNEVNGYEASTYASISDFQALGSKKLVLDWDVPNDVTIHGELKNLEGSATDRDDWLVTEVRVYKFDAAGQESHYLEGGLYAAETRVVEEFVVIKAPLGWRVSRVNDTAYDATTVNLPSFNTHEFYSVTFSLGLPESTDDGETKRGGKLPAFESWVLGLVLVVLGVGLRRTLWMK